MPITQKEFIQKTWDRADVELHHANGDFAETSGMYPVHGRTELRRSPTWSSHLTHAGLTTVRAIFFDHANERYVLVGTDGSSHLACTHFSSAWSHVGSSTSLVAACTALGGLSMLNCSYWGGTLWLIGDDNDVYRGAYSGALASFYGGGDAVILAPLGDRMYMATSDGTIYRLNDADSAFEAHYTPVREFSPRFMAAFRSYLLTVGRHADGSIHFYRLPAYTGNDPTHLQELGHAPHVSGMYRTFGALFALHEDDLYFSPGYTSRSDGEKTLDVYRFNGSRVDHVAHLPTAGTTNPNYMGLLAWRGELIFAAPSGTGAPNCQMLVGDRFHDFLPSSTLVAATNPIVASLNGEIILTGLDGATEGIHHAGNTDYYDGYAVTSWLDMDFPGRKKLLHRLSAFLSDANATTTLTLKYRVDDQTAWTQAGTQTAANAHLVVDGLATEFYRLQIRVELGDSGAASAGDLTLQAIAAIYSIGGK